MNTQSKSRETIMDPQTGMITTQEFIDQERRRNKAEWKESWKRKPYEERRVHLEIKRMYQGSN